MKVGDYVKINWNDVNLSFDDKTLNQIYKIISFGNDNKDVFGYLVENIITLEKNFTQKRYLYKDVETKAINRKEKIEKILNDN